MANDYSVNATSRATWKEMEEFDLLDKYFSARSDGSLTTDKGIKSKAWNKIVSAFSKHNRALDRGQYKSKYNRLMQDYDLYKYLINVSGAGICPDTGKPMLGDDVWEKLLTDKPTQKLKIAAIRAHGFPHATVCCLIAGDTRATGSHATTVSGLVMDLTQNEPGHDKGSEGDAGGSQSSLKSKPTTTARPTPSSSLEDPAISQQQRVDKVKRIRGGALKSNRAQKKPKSDEDLTKALTSLMRTTKAYMKMKMDTSKVQSHTNYNDQEPNQDKDTSEYQMEV